MEHRLSDHDLDLLLSRCFSNVKRTAKSPFTIKNIVLLNNQVREVFASEDTALDLTAPINVCGDIHGKFLDLLRVFERGGLPPQSKYLFLGDYVDRGDNGLDVMCMLFTMKLRFPHHVYLIRGNHETPEMSSQFGFLEECAMKVSKRIYPEFVKTFEYIPLAAVIDSVFFCIHGGLSPNCDSIDMIRAVKRPLVVPEKGFIADLLWSDPSDQIDEFGPNFRGDTYTYGQKAVKKFLEAHGFKHMVRAHQMMDEGYGFAFFPDKSVITVFTVSKYTGIYDNKAAFMKIKEDGSFDFEILAQNVPKTSHLMKKNK